jgi:hypothetical protein
MVKKISLTTVQPGQKTKNDRALGEAKAMAGVDGRTIRRLGKNKPFLFRTTQARHTELVELAAQYRMSMAEILELGIDLAKAHLEEKAKISRD